jgi:CO/xanthine dehydrogenase Mo-binding subunit
VVTLPLAETTVISPTVGGGPGGKLPNEVQSMLTSAGSAGAGAASASTANKAMMRTTGRRFIKDSPFCPQTASPLHAPLTATG